LEFSDFGILLDVGIFDLLIFSGFRNIWRDFGCRFDCLEFGCIWNTLIVVFTSLGTWSMHLECAEEPTTFRFIPELTGRKKVK